MERPASSASSGAAKSQRPEVILYEVAGDITHDVFLITDTELGTGNFATVHRGVYKRDPTQQVAIKITRRNTNFNPEKFRKYLEREMEFVRMKLQHPNVLQFIDYHDDGDRVYLMMEIADAGTLKSHLASHKPLQEMDIQYFFVQLVRGLKYLHDRDIVHRDLKPENFLLKMDSNGRMILKISDFGLARQIVSEEDQLKMTALGTPLYVSPEIYGGLEYGFSTDLWGIGAILFEMVEGEHLLNPNLIQLLRLKRPFDVAARLRRARAMAHVSELIVKLLSFDPKDRCTLEWLLEHPYIKGHSYMLKFKVFVVNRATSQDLTLQLSPANPIDALIEELNTRVPPFVKGRQGASVYSAPGSSSPSSRSSPPGSSGDSAWMEKPRPVLRIYLFEDGSPVHIPRSLEDLMKQREIYVFHLEDPHSDIVVEDDFVLVDSADFGTGAIPRGTAIKSPGGALDEVNRHLSLRSKQSSALTVLMRYLNIRYSELEELERTLSLAKLVKEERDRLKMILLIKLKDLTPKSPSASYDYFDQFWVLLAQIETISRKLDLFEDEKKRLVDKLLSSQAAVTALVNSVERSLMKRDQLRKIMSSPSLIDGAMATTFRDWVVDELNNRDKTREIKLLTSSIVQSHMSIDSISAALVDIRKNITSQSQSIGALRDSVQSAIEKSRDFVPVNEAELRSLQNEISQLKQQLALEQEKNLSGESVKQSLEAQLSALQLQLESSQRKVSLLEESMLERNKLGRELEAEKAISSALRDEAKLLADSLVAAKAAQAATEDKNVEAVARYEKEIGSLRAELDDMKSQLERIQASSAQGLASSGGLSKSQGEGIVDIVLHNLDEKNKELEDVKKELQKLQSDFLDEKQAKRELRDEVNTLQPIKMEYEKLTSEVKLLKLHTQKLESERVCFSDFQERSLVIFTLHASGFYYMMYEPAQSSAQYCWILIDPFQELPSQPIPNHLVAELLTLPQFDQVTKVVSVEKGVPSPPIGSIFTTVLINPRLDLSAKLRPPPS